MLNYLETATTWDILEDITGVVLLFAIIPLAPFAIAIVKALL
jgi:hypothetical protein